MSWRGGTRGFHAGPDGDGSFKLMGPNDRLGKVSKADLPSSGLGVAEMPFVIAMDPLVGLRAAPAGQQGRARSSLEPAGRSKIGPRCRCILAAERAGSSSGRDDRRGYGGNTGISLAMIARSRGFAAW